MLEVSLRKLAVFIGLAFVVGLLIERWLVLTEPVVQILAPVTAVFGASLLWLAIGVLAGVGGTLFFRRVRETNSLDIVRNPRFKCNEDRF